MSESADKSGIFQKWASLIPLCVWRLLLELSWTGATLASFSVPLVVMDRALGEEDPWSWEGWGPTGALYGVAVGCTVVYCVARWWILKSEVKTDRASNWAAFLVGLSLFGPMVLGAIYVFAEVFSGVSLGATLFSTLAALLAAGARWGSEECLAKQAKQAEQSEQASPSAPEPR